VKLDFFISILGEAEAEIGSSDREVASRFLSRMDYKAGARFQPELNLRMLEEIHVNQETTSDQAKIITQIFILSLAPACWGGQLLNQFIQSLNL
jgi:hypothetical protein